MRVRLAVLGAAMLGILLLGVTGAGADQTFVSGLYQNQPYTCAHGSSIDPSGQSFGRFYATEQHDNALVQGYVRVDNVKPNLLYRVFVTQYGRYCIWPILAPGYEVASFWVDGQGHGDAYFTFWAHTGETSAWVTVRHGNVMTVRSTAVPINR